MRSRLSPLARLALRLVLLPVLVRLLHELALAEHDNPGFLPDPVALEVDPGEELAGRREVPLEPTIAVAGGGGGAVAVLFRHLLHIAAEQPPLPVVLRFALCEAEALP